MQTNETPGAYGFGATAAHRARVEAEIVRQREQAERRRAENAARKNGDAR